MRRSRWVWRAIGVISLLGTLLLAAGFTLAVKTVLYPEGGVESIAAVDEPLLSGEESVEIVALGDSLTVGYGDASGKGYVRGLQEQLEETLDVPVYVVGNFAQSGYTTTQVLSDLKERETIATALTQADIVVLTAGGNDLMQLGGEINPEAFRAKIPETAANIREILATIRDITPEAHIYYIGLYNPFIEYEDMEELQGTTLAVQAWNHAVFEVMEEYERVTFVPSFDLFQHGVNRFLSSDRYHLNEIGYARIASRLAMLME